MSVSLFLSPHLDDAVLSCAGAILAEVKRGRKVIVASLFTEGAPTSYYETRRAEDKAALASLGAECLWLGLWDAPFRRPFYRCFREIVLETHPDDAGYAEELGRRLQVLWRRLKPATTFVPLAVGTHIDHRLTFEAARRLPDQAELAFYEDRPYAFIRHGVALRLAEVGSGDGLASGLASEYLKSFDAARYVNVYLPPGPERELCREWLAARLAAGARRDGPALDPALVECAAGELRRVEGAVAAYGSQIKDLFGTLAGYRRSVAAYARLLGSRAAYAERVWRRK